MYRPPRSDGPRSPSSTDSPSTSIGSDASSAFRVSFISTLPPIKPPPAYVAIAAASQLATDNLKLRTTEEQYEHSDASVQEDDDGAVFTERGLALINAFLDQLLYNFLAASRSTSLASLRTAVEQVLKGKLGRWAINSADEELHELLADGEDDELALLQDEQDGGRRNNLELIFKRTRLRIMVYTRLGEMEDEDEDVFLEQEGLLPHDTSTKRFSAESGLVSWAAAIFLTSILEFIAEQSIEVAGQAAFDRVALKKASASTPLSDGSRDISRDDRIVIEEHDVERIALNSTLGRLWRTWRKNLRSPRNTAFQPSHSHTVSTRTSAATLRPQSPVGPNRDGQGMMGLADSRSISQQARSGTPVKRLSQMSVQRSSTESATRFQPSRQSYSSDEETQGSKKRSRENDKRASLPALQSPTVNGHREKSPVSSHASKIAWRSNQTLVTRPGSRGNDNQAGSTSRVAHHPRIEGEHAVVPVSGVPHLHQPQSMSRSHATNSNSLSKNGVPLDNDNARDTGMVYQRPEQGHPNRLSNNKTRDVVYHDAQRANSPRTNTGPSIVNVTTSDHHPPQPAVLNTYQTIYSGVNGLKVQIPTDPSKPWHGTDRQASHPVPQTNGTKSTDGTPGQGLQQPPRILRTVSATCITPPSGTYSIQSSEWASEPATSAKTKSPSSPPLQTRPTAGNLTPVKSGQFLREPRIQTETVLDLTDFLRSTAPDEEQAYAPPIMTMITAQPQSNGTSAPSQIQRPSSTQSIRTNGTSKSVRSPKIPSRQSSIKHTAENEKIRDLKSDDPVIAPTSISPGSIRSVRSNLQPRDPVVRGRGNDDLLDFLREGPPGADVSKPTPRESMERRTANKFTIVPLQNRTTEMSMKPRSTKNSSLGSSTTKRDHPATVTSALPTAPQHKPNTKARMKDPYAAESGDEDEDVLTALPRKGRREESLIDFLQNSGPDGSAIKGAKGPRSKVPPGAAARGPKLPPLKTNPSPPEGSRPRTPPGIMSTMAFGANAKAPLTPELGEFLTGPGTSLDLALHSNNWRARSRDEGDTAPAPDVNRSRQDVEKAKMQGKGMKGLFRKISSTG